MRGKQKNIRIPLEIFVFFEKKLQPMFWFKNIEIRWVVVAPLFGES